MAKESLKKLFVFSIIILFLFVSILPSINSSSTTNNQPLITCLDNTPPDKPQAPRFKSNDRDPTEPCCWKAGYDYKAQTFDPDGDDIRYGWDWDGDDAVDEWAPSETEYYGNYAWQRRYHKWEDIGTFNLKVLAEDIHGARSEWSDPLITVVREKCGPYIEELKGPSYAKVNRESAEFYVGAFDCQDEDIYYWFDWGDGTNTGWTEDCTPRHTWTERKSYTISIKAIDDPDGDGNVSDGIETPTYHRTIDVKYIRSKNTFILEHFPLLAKLLPFLPF